MLFTWLVVVLLLVVWLCAFVALTACAPLLFTARHERRLRRACRWIWSVCETVWWLGPRPTLITLRRARSRRLPVATRFSRRRAA